MHAHHIWVYICLCVSVCVRGLWVNALTVYSIMCVYCTRVYFYDLFVHVRVDCVLEMGRKTPFSIMTITSYM